MRTWQGCESEQDQALAGMFPHGDRLLFFRNGVCQVIRDFLRHASASQKYLPPPPWLLPAAEPPLSKSLSFSFFRRADTIHEEEGVRYVLVGGEAADGYHRVRTLFPSTLTISKGYEKITFII